MSKKLIAAAVLALSTAQVYAQNSPISFNARSIVTLSDADISASSFIDGKLLRTGANDRLTTIKFPLMRANSVQSIVVQNSAINTGKSVAVSPSGDLAFVIESTSTPAQTVTEFNNITTDSPSGQRVYVVDIANPATPKVKFPFSIGTNPLAIDINKNELIVSTAENGKKLAFLETDTDGKPTRLLYLPIDTDSTQNLVDISWDPSGEYIGASLAPSGELVTYKVIRENGKLKNIETIGKPTKLGTHLTFGKFSADGKKYFVVDSKGERGQTTAEGELLVINLDLTTGDHKIASKTTVGLNPGAFAISPDNKLLVTTQASKSIQPWNSANPGQGATIGLASIGMDGTIQKIVDYPVGGILPTSVAFDKDGSNVAVSIFEYLEYGLRSGGIEFFQVIKGDGPTLKKQSGKVSVERGIHTFRVIH